MGLLNTLRDTFPFKIIIDELNRFVRELYHGNIPPLKNRNQPYNDNKLRTKAKIPNTPESDW